MSFWRFNELAMRLVDLGDFVFEALQEDSFFEPVSKHDFEIIVLPRFLDILIEPDIVDGFDRVFLVRVAGQENSRRFGLNFLDSGEKRDAIHVRHQVIGNDDVDSVGLDELERVRGLRETVDVVIRFEREKTFDAGHHHILVVDEDDDR